MVDDSNLSVDCIVSLFDITLDELRGVEILYATYDQYGYEGVAFVLFRKDGKLYEVNASHCSCNEIAGQWEPSFTTVKAILMRPNLPTQLKDLVDTFDNSTE